MMTKKSIPNLFYRRYYKRSLSYSFFNIKICFFLIRFGSTICPFEFDRKNGIVFESRIEKQGTFRHHLFSLSVFTFLFCKCNNVVQWSFHWNHQNGDYSWFVGVTKKWNFWTKKITKILMQKSYQKKTCISQPNQRKVKNIINYYFKTLHKSVCFCTSNKSNKRL